MDKTSILMLEDFELGGEKQEAGSLISVNEDLAKLLIEKGVAEEKTLEQHVEDKAREAEEARKAEEAKQAEKEKEQIETAVVAKVRDRIGDDPRGGYRYYGEFAKEVKIASHPGAINVPERLRRWDGFVRANPVFEQKLPDGTTKVTMVEYDDEQGGYLVPTQFRAELLRIALETSIVSSRARFIPMQTNAISLPAVNLTSNATNFFGGVTVYRPAEAASKTSSKPAFGKVTLTLHKLIVMVEVSDELLEDSPISIEPLLLDMAGQAIGFQQDDDFLNGTGVNMALGCINAGNPSLIQESRNIAGAIRYDDIIDMWTRLWPAAQSRAIWLVSMSALNDVMRMTYPGGATPYPVYMPAGGIAATPYSTIMGRPVFTTEKCAALGTMGDIALVDLSQYLMGGKPGGGIKADSSIHLYFNYDKTAFRYVLRYDGQPWWLSDVTPHNGGATYSPFVVLADDSFESTTTAAPTTTTAG